MSKYPILEDRIELAHFLKGELPLYIGISTIDQHYPNHYHEFVELSLIIEGTGVEVINGKKHTLSPGAMSFLLPHSIHDWSSEPNSSLRIYCCMFDIDLLLGSYLDSALCSSLLRIGDEWTPYIHLDDAAFSSMLVLFQNLHAESQKNELGKPSMLLSLLIEILVTFVRSHPKTTNQNPGQDGHSPRDVWNFIHYIHKHYTDGSTSLKTVSEHFGVSPAYISRTVRELVGNTFLDYLHMLRIRRAIGLLASTDMTITEISIDAGFESLRTFTRVFKEAKGVTPTEYRAAIKG